MIYKDYRILATISTSIFYEFDENGTPTELVGGIEYEEGNDSVWYSVVDKSNFAIQTFQEVKDAISFINEEV